MRPIAVILATALATATNHRNHREDSALKAGKRIAAVLLGFVGFSLCLAAADGPGLVPKKQAVGIITTHVRGVSGSIVLDGTGNLYIAGARENLRHQVRRVDAATGDIAAVAGTGVEGFSGDGGPATQARLNTPGSIVLDGAGNLYIADSGNDRVRKVDAQTGIITTVAGTGVEGFSGDGGLATQARLNIPRAMTLARGGGLAVDGAGNLYITDGGNHRVRKVDAQTGIITTVAGTGAYGDSGDGGLATRARLSGPGSIAVDGTGNLYIADSGNNRVRKVDGATQVIMAVAGTGARGARGDGGLATQARIADLTDLAVDGAGNLYIADLSSQRVRRVDARTGIIRTVAGTGARGDSGDGGLATEAAFYEPATVAVDGTGNLYIVDYSVERVRKVSRIAAPLGSVSGVGPVGTVHGSSGWVCQAGPVGNPRRTYFLSRQFQSDAIDLWEFFTYLENQYGDVLREVRAVNATIPISLLDCDTAEAAVSLLATLDNLSEVEDSRLELTDWAPEGESGQRLCGLLFPQERCRSYRSPGGGARSYIIPASSAGSGAGAGTGTEGSGDTGAGGETGSGGGSAGTATAIEVGSSVAGRIGAAGEVDHYRFEVSEAVRVEVYTTGSTDTFGRLDSSATNDDGGRGYNFRIEASVTAGAHIVQVSGYGGETGDYVLHVRALGDSGAGGGETGSGGGSAGTATAIEVGSSVTGRIGAAGEVDHYRFEVSEAVRVEVYTTGSTDTFGRLDSSATNDDGGQGYNFRIEAAVAAGVHIVQVSGYGGATGDYVLHVRALGDSGAGGGDTGNGGGSADTATAIEVGSSVAGRIGAAGEVDRYRFEVSEAVRVEVYTTGSTDTFGRLDDSATNDDGGQGYNFRIEAAVAAGVHIVQVSGYGSTTGDYVLHVRALGDTGTGGSGAGSGGSGSGSGTGVTEQVPRLDEFRCETCDPDGDSTVARFRQGDFSGALQARVIDPACDCPFPNNVIPQSRLASLPNGAWPEEIYERNVREGTFTVAGGRKARLVAQGWTPLHEAVANGSSAHPRGWLNPARLDEVLAGWPLAIEAELRNLGSRSGWRPLHLAARRANPGVVRRLLEHRPAVDARAVDGMTPLLVAGTREVFAALRAAGADIRARRDSGWTALHNAARLRDMDAATVGSLVAAGLDPNAATDNGWVPLHYASSPEVFAALRAAGAEVEARTDRGWTVLHSAALLTDAATVGSLVAAGLDPNAATNDGWTPLLRAGTREVFAALLELGADRAGIEAAFAPDAFREVQGGGEGALGAVQLSNAVRQVGRFGDAAWFERLRAVNPDFYAVPGNPRSAAPIFPLHWAVRDNEDPAAVAALTGEASATDGWSVDVNQRSSWGRPLSIAARWNGNPAVVRALLAAGAEVNADEGAALYAAALNEQPRAAEIVGELLAAGADVDGVEPADRGRARRPVYAAALAQNLATLDALLAAGAEVNVEGSAAGYSLLADVLSRGRFDCGYGAVAERLRSAGARAERGAGETFVPGPPVAECGGTGSGTGGAGTGNGGRSAGTATAIEVGSSLAGRIAAWGEVDHYRFEVGEAARVAIYTLGSTDTFGRLDSSASDDDAGDGSNFRIEASVGAGVHIVQVSGSGSVATGAYTLHVQLVSGGAGSGGSAGPAAGGTWTNTLGMEFVGIPAGSFVMGSPEHEEGRYSDERQREVRISQGFWMGKYEVTQGEWEAVMGTNPSGFPECGARCPVERVSWDDVQEFIRRLNERESASGYVYRLPTEAEWEYAARAGTTGARHGELDEVAWYSDNSGRTTHPVGEKQANAWGLHDTLGNVWEWVADWYGEYPAGAVTDPQGPDTGTTRVIRGGGWSSSAGDVRSADRGHGSPGGRGNGLGFRLVRTE